jgi:hypothetical protein
VARPKSYGTFGPFVQTHPIHAETYEEFWADELQLFHNPNAKHSIDPEAFGGITQHFFRDGEYSSVIPKDTVLMSRTIIISPVADDAHLDTAT